MSLKTTLEEDMKRAMKSSDSVTLSVIRIAITAIRNEEIALGHDLSDVETQRVLGKQVKQLQDANVDFIRGGRPDLAGSNQIEIEILQRYLPEPLTTEAIQGMVKEIITKEKPTSSKDIGRVMGAVMKLVAGRADGNIVKEIVHAELKDILSS